MYHLSPKIKRSKLLASGTKHNYLVPIYVEYAAMTKQWTGEGKKFDAHRKKLFGPYDYVTADLYQDFEMAEALHMSYADFMATEIHLRAKLIAWQRLRNMLKTMERNLEIIEENNKKPSTGEGDAKAKQARNGVAG